MNKQEKTQADPAERHDEPKAVRKKPGSLRGKVAVVAGATRGAGRGIARAPGELGRPFIAPVAHREKRGPI